MFFYFNANLEWKMAFFLSHLYFYFKIDLSYSLFHPAKLFNFALLILLTPKYLNLHRICSLAETSNRTNKQILVHLLHIQDLCLRKNKVDLFL